jgi:predicted PurR-regulated permease PerM
MPDKRKSRKAFEFGTLTGLAYLVVSFCALSWAKDFLLLIVLAILISFLLTPAVTRLEQLGLHPGLAILGIVAIAFVLVGAVLATVTVQAVDLTNSLPKYRDNIEAKWVAIQRGPPGPVNLAFRNVGELVNDPAGGGQQPQPVKVEVVSGGARLVSLVRAPA